MVNDFMKFIGYFSEAQFTTIKISLYSRQDKNVFSKLHKN